MLGCLCYDGILFLFEILLSALNLVNPLDYCFLRLGSLFKTGNIDSSIT
jgi:hypothetical protein